MSRCAVVVATPNVPRTTEQSRSQSQIAVAIEDWNERKRNTLGIPSKVFVLREDVAHGATITSD
jgi:hypothetical protein